MVQRALYRQTPSRAVWSTKCWLAAQLKYIRRHVCHTVFDKHVGALSRVAIHGQTYSRKVIHKVGG